MSMSLQVIEVKFLHVGVDDVRGKLKAAGGTLVHPMRLMRRDQFDHTDSRYTKGDYHERLRIRDEGDKFTMTYKKTTSESNYATEIETTIGSYEDTKKLLTAIGLHSFSYQESKRETWLLGDVEVVIDEWPWLDPYIEIVGPSEKSIKAAVRTLGFDWKDAKYRSVDTAYRDQYPKMLEQDSIGMVPVIRFGDPMPDFLKERM
jgi:adenylate cyclase, class 2